MKNTHKAAGAGINKDEFLKNSLQQILASESLESQRQLVSSIAAELAVDMLDCAAALVYLLQVDADLLPVIPLIESKIGIKMVRYRLAIGRQHEITEEKLKKVLVEESGVDKNNIQNVMIRGLYTLIELPDAMPPEIFQHLKTVEINHQKLDIKRVKTRNNKKRGSSHGRRGKQRTANANQQIADQLTG